MLWRGIHTVPTMVSQINPLFHTSTVRPKSRRLISLWKKEQRGKRKISLHCQREEWEPFTFHHVYMYVCLYVFVDVLTTICHVFNVHMVNKCKSTYSTHALSCLFTHLQEVFVHSCSYSASFLHLSSQPA